MRILLPERWIGFFVAGCVLALFFFPLAHGPFQATHGPTTAFRARRQIFGFIYSAVRAVLLIFAGVLPSIVESLRPPAWGLGQPSNVLLETPSTAVLRC